MPAPVFSSVTYLSPWLPLPPGQAMLGLDAIVNSGGPSGQVLAGQLRQGANQLAVAVSPSSSTEVTIMPPYPLSSMLDYAVDVQWVAAGTPAGNVIWTNAAAIATAPVLTAFARGVYGLVSGKQVQLMWEFGAAAVMPAGVTVTGFNSKGKSVGYLIQAGTGGTLAMSGAPDVGTRLYFQAMMPISGDPKAGFKPPFTFGPIQSGLPLPLAAPTLTAMQCDGASVQISWTPPPLPDPPPFDVRYELGLLDAHDNLLGWLPAGPGGGIAQLPSPLGGPLQVAARTRYGSFIGAAGPASAVLDMSATITAITVASDSQSAKVEFADASLPAGSVLVAEVTGPGGDSTAVAQGSPPQANVPIKLVSGGGYAIAGYCQANAGGIASSGPAGPAFAVPTMPVTGLAVTFDGDRARVSWEPSGEPGVVRYQIGAAVDGASATYVSDSNAFVVPLVPVAGGSLTVSVAPMGDLAVGPAAKLQLTAPMPSAPSIVATSFDGTMARVDWAPVTEGPLDGYSATFTGIDSTDHALAFAVALGEQTGMATALPSDGRAHAWSVQISAMAGKRGTPSPAAWIPTIAPVLGPCSVATADQGLAVTIGWALDCTTQQLEAMLKAGAQLEFALLDGDNSVVVTQQPFAAASGTAQLTLDLIGSAQQYLTARLVGPALTDNPVPQFTTGPRAAPVPLLAVAPVVTGANYDGTNLAVAWSGGLAGASGWQVTLTGTDAKESQTFQTGPEPRLDVPAVINGGTWTVIVQALGPNSTGLSSTAFALATPQLNPPTIETLDWDGSTLSVSWTPSAALADYQLLVASENNNDLLAGLVVGVETSVSFPLTIPGDAMNPTATVGARRANWTDVKAQAKASIVITAPSIAGISVDPGTGLATAKWDAVPGATGYRVRLTESGADAGVIRETSTPSIDFEPPAGASLAVSASAIVADAPLRATGPFGTPAALPTLAPAISMTAFDGTNVSLAWQPVAGAAGYRASVFEQGATQPIVPPVHLPAESAASFACGFPAPEKTYMLVLQALFGDFEGPPSAPAPLLTSAPALSQPAFDGRTVSVVTAAPAGPTPAGYALTVLRDGAEIQNASLPAAARLDLALATPADPAAAYTLAVRPQLGVALGPVAGTAFAVAAPPLTATVWGGSQIDANVALPSGWSAQGRLLVDGVPQAPVPFDAGGNASLAVPDNGAVAISVQGTIDGATGPWSVPLALSRAVPDGIALELDGRALTVAWQAVEGADSYAVTLKSAGHPDVTTVVSRPAATLTVQDVNAATEVLVAAIRGIATGPSSTPVAAIMAPAPLVNVDYQDGMLSLAWNEVTGATGYRVIVTTGETTSAEADFNEAQGSLPVPPGNYGVAVRAFDGAALGPPAAPATPAVFAPELSSAEFAATGDLAVSWPMVGSSTDYTVRLLAPDQGYVDTPAHGTGPMINCVIPAAQVPARACRLLCRVASQGQIPTLTGPWSAPLDVPAAVPAGTEVQLDGMLLSASWEPVEGADGYAATFITDQGPGLTLRVYEPQAAFHLPSGASTASVTVAATFGAAVGRASAPAVAALFGTPQLSQAEYQDGQLSLAWSAVAEATSYRVELMTGEIAAIEAEFADTAGAIPAPVGSYDIVLRALTDSAAGPASEPIAAITATPVIAAASFDPATGDCTVSWPDITGTALYGIRLTAPGQQPFEDTVPGGQPTVSYRIAAAKLSGGPYAFACQARSASGGPALGGPWSAALALPVPVPQGIALQLDEGGMAVTWQAVEQASGYAVTLTTDKSAPATDLVYGPRAMLTLPADATSASVAVAAQFGIAIGKASAATNAIFAAPTIGQAAYHDGVLSLAWSAVTGASGYRASVLSGTTVVAEAEFTGLEGALSVPAGQYSVEVRVLAGDAAGPASAAVEPLTTAPAIASAAFDPASGDCTVSWPALGTPAYGIRLSQPGVMPFVDAFGSDSDPVIYRIPAARLAGGPFSFVCRTLDAVASPVASGPWSVPLALPQAVPQGVALQLDGQQLAASWDVVDGATGYMAQVTVDSGSPSQVVFQPYANFILPDGTTSASVRVGAIFGSVTGMASPAVYAIFALPALTSAAYDGTTLDLAWTSGTGSSGTRVALLAGDSALFEADFAGSQGAVPVAPGVWQVELRALAPESAGPATAPVTPISAPPQVMSAVFDPLTGACTLSWPAVAGADGYATALWQPGQPVVSGTIKHGGPTVTCIIPAAQLAGGGPFSFSAQATADGPPALSGPWSAPVALPSLAPASLEASYDGIVVRGSWAAVGGAEGYRLSLVSGGAASQLGDVAGTTATIVPASPPSADTALTVQALGPLGPGPAAAAVPVFARGWFITAQSPWGAAPLTSPSAAATDLVLALPDLFGGSQPAGPLPDNATFKVAATAGGYTLTVLGNGPAWLWDPTSRAAVRTDYDDLTAKLEGAGWTAQMRALVLDAVARSLPQTFAEACYYAYGFEPGQGWFDLRPGMVLRVEYEAYQYLGPASSLPDPSQAKYLDGFVASGVADYPVSCSGDGPDWFVTLDAALAQMAVSEGIQVPTMAPQGDFAPGGGGLIDAFFDQFRQPLCRLVYPPNILDQDSVGDARRANNPVLIAASTLADLQTAAGAVRNAGPLPSGVGAFYFRGRTTLTPRIRVQLDGTPLLVPLGTTVGDVLAEQGARGAAPGAGLKVRRATGAAAILPDRPAWLDVRLDWNGANPAWLGLPLLAGDRIEAGG